MGAPERVYWRQPDHADSGYLSVHDTAGLPDGETVVYEPVDPDRLTTGEWHDRAVAAEDRVQSLENMASAHERARDVANGLRLAAEARIDRLQADLERREAALGRATMVLRRFYENTAWAQRQDWLPNVFPVVEPEPPGCWADVLRWISDTGVGHGQEGDPQTSAAPQPPEAPPLEERRGRVARFLPRSLGGDADRVSGPGARLAPDRGERMEVATPEERRRAAEDPHWSD